MRILVIGAYGLIGTGILARLMERGHEVVGLGRDVAAAQHRFPQATWIRRDLRSMTSPGDWTMLLSGIDAVVNAAGALQDGGRDDLEAVHVSAPMALYRACEMAGPRRVIHISAAGTGADRATAFSSTKHRLDTALAALDLDWLILRPGLVLAPQAYGGSALLRGLAGLPFVIPAVASQAPVQVVALSDVAETVARALASEAPKRGTFDLLHPQQLGLPEVLTGLRGWLGLAPAPVVTLPLWTVRLAGHVADGLASLGWRSPVRTTTLAQLQQGITGDAAPWQAAFGLKPRSLAEMLVAHPAGVQERWFARLYFLKPAALAGLATFWALSGLIGLARISAAAQTLVQAGWDLGPAQAAVVVGSLVDLGLGLSACHHATARKALVGMVLVSLGYLLAGTLARPDLWLDPLGSYLKVVPGTLLAALTLAMMDER